MPLTKDTMTVASRIMLPVYVVFFGWVGINWMTTPLPRLTESPGLRYLNEVLDLRGLGCALTGAAFLIALALLTKRRDMARYALILAGFCMAALLVAFLIAPFFSDTSPSAGAWPFLGLAACRASYKSVTRHEVS